MATNTKGIYYRANTDAAATSEAQAVSVAESVPVGPNYIVNGSFDFWQRGTSLSSSGYLADRFTLAGVSGFTQSRQSFTPGAAPVSGYEASYYWNVTMTSSNQNGEFLQRIEDARTLAGQTVTLSFWARSTAGAQPLNCNIYQYFGTGGSPSALTAAPGGGSYTPTASWQRYSFTFTIPSVSGKTFGTNNDSFLWVRIGQFTTTATNTSLDIWGVQLELGSTATSFKRNSPSLQAELAACMRYFYRINGGTADGGLVQGMFYSGTELWCTITHPVPMRVCPTTSVGTGSGLSVYAGGGGNRGFNSYTTYGTSASQTMSMTIRFIVNSGTTAGYGGWAAGTGTYLQFDSEL